MYAATNTSHAQTITWINVDEISTSKSNMWILSHFDILNASFGLQSCAFWCRSGLGKWGKLKGTLAGPHLRTREICFEGENEKRENIAP